MSIAPQGSRRFRAYLAYRSDSELRIQGAAALSRFIEESIGCGAPAAFYSKTVAVGPLASFAGADSWVGHPYSSGVTLIGDVAAATSEDAKGLLDELNG